MSIGLVFIVALMQTLYVVKKKDIYKKMAKFWGHLFLINFAVGVVTGILQEFQFGMNWSDYSRFVGDVFGAPLAIEALLAFSLNRPLLVFGYSAGTVYRKNSFVMYLARFSWYDLFGVLDFTRQLIYAGASWICD